MRRVHAEHSSCRCSLGGLSTVLSETGKRHDVLMRVYSVLPTDAFVILLMGDQW